MQTERLVQARARAPFQTQSSQALLSRVRTNEAGLAARQELAIRFRLAIVLLMHQLRRSLLIQ